MPLEPASASPDHADGRFPEPLGVGGSSVKWQRSPNITSAVSSLPRTAKNASNTPGRTRVNQPEELLLIHQNLSITEVCFAVGYSSLGSFSSRDPARDCRRNAECVSASLRRQSTRIPGCYLFYERIPRAKDRNLGEASGVSW